MAYFAPLPTPFTDDGFTISEIRLARVVRWLLGRGVTGLVVGTDVGEFLSLGHDERKQVVEWSLREVRSAVEIWVNVTSLSTIASLDLAQHASRHGARGIIVCPPYHGNYDQEELVIYLQTAGQYSHLGVLIADPAKQLNMTSRTTLESHPGVGLAPAGEPLDELSGTFPIDGIAPFLLEGLPEAQIAGIRHLARTSGYAKVVKAMLHIQNNDLGPTRPPIRSLDGEKLDELKSLMTVSSTRLNGINRLAS